MEINASGLPTPWPIALIGTIISVVGILLSQTEKYSLSWLTKSSIVLTLIRSLAGFGSLFYSLIIYGGISGFQYPVLALTVPLGLLPIVHSLRRGIKNLKTSEITDATEEEIELGTRNSNELTESIEEEEREIVEEKKYLDNIFSKLRFLSWLLIVFSWISCISSISIYNDLKNIPVASQFITNCSTNLSQNTTNAFLRCNGNNTCYISSKSINEIDWVIKGIVLFATLFIMGLYGARIRAKGDPKFRRKVIKAGATPETIRKSYEVKFLGRIISIVIVVISFIYLVAIAVVQVKGLDTNGLEEKCDINQELTSSKTGYIKEWAIDKANTARHIALL